MKETMNNNYGTEEKVLVTAIDHGFGNMKTVNGNSEYAHRSASISGRERTDSSRFAVYRSEQR